MSKNILILTPFYPPNIGGAETFTEGLVKEIVKWQSVTVLTYQPCAKSKCLPYEEYISEGGSLRIHRLNWLLNIRGAWRGIGLKKLLLSSPPLGIVAFKLLLTIKFDIIHAQGLISGLVAVLLKKVFKIKTFITLLALYEFKKQSKIFNAVARFIFNNSDRIFVEGENGKADIAIFNLPQARIIKFQHWVDQDVFRPPDRRSGDRVCVLFIGRSIPEKGRHIIEEAEKILNDPKRYEFIYVDNVPYEELPSYYQKAHIVVVPSLYAEGFSRVVAEAASCGCLVITSNRGSLPEMVKSFGISIEPTAEDFAKQISQYVFGLGEAMNFDYPKRLFSPKNAEVFLAGY